MPYFMTELNVPVRTDCRFYRGSMPCWPHKQHGVHCSDCDYYKRVDGDLLIIKLGRVSDIIRTTPLLRRMKSEFPNHCVHWLTDYPEALPSGEWIDRVHSLTMRSMVTLQAMRFDAIYCLDRYPEAAATATLLSTDSVYGYTLHHNEVMPATRYTGEYGAMQAAKNKWLAGLFDDIGKQSTHSYQQELFAMCGFEYQGEEYLLPESEPHGLTLPDGKQLVGLNTGTGRGWNTLLWPEENWFELIRKLQSSGYCPILLGGDATHERNLRLRAQTGALYIGCLPFKKFISLIGDLHLIVTAEATALHLAIGLRRRIVVLNNVFNRQELDLYGLGEVVEPDPPCTCFYVPDCPQGGCMQRISPEMLFTAIERQLTL